MQRISSNMQHSDSSYSVRRQESRLHKVNSQLSTQRRIQQLRDDPIAAGHSVRYKSLLARLDRFEKNAKTLNDQYKVTEAPMQSALGIMQRLRELSVAGATGTYTASDLKKMAPEVDELLYELVQTANTVGADGTRLFAGTKSFTEPFEIVMGDIDGAGSAVITDVRYNGSIDTKQVESDELSFMAANQAGNRVFWAEKQVLFSETDARNYIVQQDSTIEVDGVNIPLIAGDNVYAIMSKINSSGAAVKASLDPVTNGMNIETTDARQLWLRDSGEGNVLASLGLVKPQQRPPYNLADSVRVTGGSLFDAVIAMRNAMYAGDNESLGGKVLGSVDSAIDNLSARLAENGSRYERAEAALARLNTQIPNVTGADSRESDLDLTQAITDLKMYEYTHQASLSTIGNLYKNTLLNYLR